VSDTTFLEAAINFFCSLLRIIIIIIIIINNNNNNNRCVIVGEVVEGHNQVHNGGALFYDFIQRASTRGINKGLERGAGTIYEFQTIEIKQSKDFKTWKTYFLVLPLRLCP
jgi:hypothetical protein